MIRRKENAMLADIIISPDGAIQVITREGSFAEGKEKVESILEDLRASGMNVSAETKFEQHRHEGGKVKAGTRIEN
jgi:hypothetical protein